jgi:hypothetical protein
MGTCLIRIKFLLQSSVVDKDNKNIFSLRFEAFFGRKSNAFQLRKKKKGKVGDKKENMVEKF